ncbi:MFS transporter, partial [Streptomyces cuspidosporus]|uniref:MFS transporter n=1 Tax=Streptomyces cuspidosporus TaxID=66882 RepID=UPI0031FC6084
YGDRIGRKSTLIVTLLLMGIGTALIGLLPSYAAIGIAAPILLTVLRILQGVAVGGEWGGSVLLAMEWGTTKRRGFMASWPQLGVPLGLLLSTALVQLMSSTTGPGFLTWGWRVPFLASILLVAVGLYVRLKVLESPEFAAVKQKKTVHRMPIVEALRTQWREIVTSAFVRLSEQAPFYIFTTFVLTYGTEQLQLNRSGLLN